VKRFIPVLFICACSAPDDTSDDKLVPADRPDTPEVIVEPESLFGIFVVDEHFSYQVMLSPNSGFGYSIFQDDKLYISQPHIPAIQGLKGFSSEQDAQTAAAFAISKLQQGIFPPMVTVEELDSLGVLD